jgi:hypothetical protein
VVITPLVNGKVPKPAKKGKKANDNAPTALALDDPKASTRSVDPKAVAEQVANRTNGGNARQLKARELLTIVQTSTDPQAVYKTAQELVAFKKAAKVGWDRFGFVENEVTELLAIANGPAPVATPAPALTPMAKAAQSLPAPKPVSTEGMSRQDKAAALLNVINSTAPASERGLAAVNLMALKRTSKVSYEKLGVTISEADLQKIAKAGASVQPEVAVKAVQVQTGGSRQEVARSLFEAKSWAMLNDHKRKAKIGWEALGFTDEEVKTIKSHI